MRPMTTAPIINRPASCSAVRAFGWAASAAPCCAAMDTATPPASNSELESNVPLHESAAILAALTDQTQATEIKNFMAAGNAVVPAIMLLVIG